MRHIVFSAHATAGWWQREIIDSGKLPILVCLLAFVLTFVATRVITRMIRAGVGPFKNNVTTSGLHIHHSVPGLILLIFGAVTSLSPGGPVSRAFAGLLVGVGASLVLDEFALILHLSDVYWTNEGRASVQAVALTGCCLALVLVGASPLGVEDVADAEGKARWALVAMVVLTGTAVIVCALKGKYRLVLLAIFVPLVAFAGAVRLARPGSPWYRRYAGDEAKKRRAVEREKRWNSIDPKLLWLPDVIAGAPSPNEAGTVQSPPERTSGADSS